MHSVFASYATEEFAHRRDHLCDSASAVGFSDVRRLSPQDFKNTDFARDNADILGRARGGGYWLWKPYLILKSLRNMSRGDLLVYCDAGRTGYYRFRAFPHRLAARAMAKASGYLLGPVISQHGPLSRWTKRDCLHLINMDRPDILKRPMIQATWSFWTPTPEAFSFLETWLVFCRDPRCLTDDPNTCGKENYPDFEDHRHDQSILTLLAYRDSAPYLDFPNTSLYRILALRPRSQLAHLFLKRIDDAERMLKSPAPAVLLRSFVDLRQAREG